MCKYLRSIVPVSFILLLLSACSIQMPVTEGMVFSSTDPYGQKHDEILPFIRYGTAISTTSTMGYARFREAAVDEYGATEARELNGRYMRAGGMPGFGFSFGSGRKVAVGFTPGLVIAGVHADATVRMMEKVFFTVNHNISQNGTELILQRPILERSGGGLSLGGFYRSQPMQFVQSDRQALISEDLFCIHWYGVRLMAQTPDFEGGAMNLRGFINVGQIREFKVPLVAVGLSVAID